MPNNPILAYNNLAMSTDNKLDFNAAVLDGLYLFSQSEGHRNYLVSEFLAYLVYPVLHNKIKIFYEDGKPIGLVTWCFLPNDKAQAFLNDDYIIQEEDYIANEGDQLWGIEFIAPFGKVLHIMKSMQKVQTELYAVSDRKVYWRRFKNRNSIHKGVFK